MAELEYTLTRDTVFKILFANNENLLKRLIAELLSIEYDSIEHFFITNPEILPKSMDEKFCRLDINMIVNGQIIDLEVQVADEGDYRERSLYYWAKVFSSTIKMGGKYSQLPRTIVISILAFNLFDCKEFHSEFRALEITRYTELTDRMSLHYYELPKLPESMDVNNILGLWLKLFSAKTEEELAKIDALEVPVMSEAIKAYQRVLTSAKLRELERLREKASHDEAQALHNAEQKGARDERKLWESVVVEKDATINEKNAEIEALQIQLHKLNKQKS